MRAIQRSEDSVTDMSIDVPEFIQPIRSRELLTAVPPVVREQYLDLLATAPVDQIPVEVVYGTNGTSRMLAASGATYDDLQRSVNLMLSRMDPQERRDFILGNAIDRCYMDGVGESTATRQMKLTTGFADALTGGHGSEEVGMSASDPIAATAIYRRSILGDDPNNIGE